MNRQANTARGATEESSRLELLSVAPRAGRPLLKTLWARRLMSPFCCCTSIRRLSEGELHFVQNPPGRGYIPGDSLATLMGFKDFSQLKGKLSKSFPLGWESQLRVVQRGEKTFGRSFFFPTGATREQNGITVGSTETKKRRARGSSSSSAAPSNTWRYAFEDISHVAEIFDDNEEMLVGKLIGFNYWGDNADGSDSDDEDENDEVFDGFLQGLDGYSAGRERRVNVGTICSATEGEWASDRRRCVLKTVREFKALGFLCGERWEGVSLSSCGYSTLAAAPPTRRSIGAANNKRPMPYMDGSPTDSSRRQRTTSQRL